MLISKCKGSFNVHDLVHDFLKKYRKDHVSSLWCLHTPKVSRKHTTNYVPKFPIFSALKLSSFELVDFINMNMYMLTEGRNFKPFLKENYAIWAVVTYLLKKCLT